ncbi:MAG TPA: hypothetical protein VE618_03935, partial [Myxococcaceae bacterium]|nr:hypothetical protein [Myxococcaceae bacterium]
VSGMASELGLTDEGQDRSRSGHQSTWQQNPSRPTWKAEGSDESGYGYGSGSTGSGWQGTNPDDERGEGSGFGYRDPDDLNRK